MVAKFVRQATQEREGRHFATYDSIRKDNSDFLNGSTELVLSDTALILNVKEFKCFGQECGFFLGRRALLRQLRLQILLKTGKQARHIQMVR